MDSILLYEIWLTIQLIFTQPLFYWAIFLIFASAYERVERERMNFGYKIFKWDRELRESLVFSLVFSLIISVLMIATGFVFPYETIYLLNIVIILLSLNCRYSFLSPAYTIGLTFILMLLLPLVLPYQSILPTFLFTDNNFIGLTFLLAFLLFGEALLMRRIKRNDGYPNLVKSKRGIWVGEQRLRKFSLLPLFLLVPHGLIEPIFPYWPSFDLGYQTYSVILLPFVMGFDQRTKGSLPNIMAKELSKGIFALSLIVFALAIGSVYYEFLSYLAIFIAITGREFIVYRTKTSDDLKSPYYTSLNEGLRVLTVLPHSPAEKSGLQVGEVIVRVNHIPVSTSDEFYKALQDSRSFYRLDVLDDAGELRFIQGAFYEDDDHKLGILFPGNRYSEKEFISSSG